jgi:uncharacterized protein YgiM (DUF1202 family)
MKLKLLSFLILISSTLVYAEEIEIKLRSGQLRLRQSAESGAKSCGSVSSGTKLNTLQVVNGWYQVQTNNPECPTAWIHSYFTKKYYSGSQSSDFLANWNPQTTKIKLDSGALKLRTKPGFSNKSCGSIENGTEVTKLSEKNGWFLIQTSNPKCPTAWVHGYYTEGQYNGPQTKKYLDSWMPATSIAAEESTTNTNAKTAPSIPSEAVLEDIPSPEKIPAEASQESPIQPEVNTTNLVDTRASENTTPNLAPEAKVSSEIAADQPAASAPVYNATQEEKTLCTFYVESNKHRTTEIDSIKTNNCLSLMKLADQRKISKEALVYTLNYLKLNMGEIQDKSCTRAKSKNTKDGIKNGCQFVINDLNKTANNNATQSPSYFIDLCDGGPKSSKRGLLTKSYINRGTGSVAGFGSYTDKPGKKTTLVGPFLTGAASHFVPFKVNRSYKNIGWSDCFVVDKNGRKTGKYKPLSQCSVTRLELYGLSSSNNSSDDGKPMHVSPYKSSWGCPSIPKEDRWKILELNQNGPSLVMNYGPKKYHTKSSLTNCHNE